MQTDEISVRDSIVAAMDEIENKEVAPEEEIEEEELVEDLEDIEVAPVEEKKTRQRGPDGKFVKTEQELIEGKQEAPKAVVEPPKSWSGAVKEKWATLPPEVQSEIRKREDDIHKMFTSQDGELRLGRELKDIITPYMPIIAAEGGTPAAAVQSLLNTAYQLRTAQPAQKLELFRKLAQQYQIDLGQVQNAPQVDPVLSAVQNEVAQLRTLISSQQQQQKSAEDQRIQSEIQAFAANPKNVHFEQVKAKMAPLLASGQAKDLQEAYDSACWADPTIRSTLLQAQEAERMAKRKEEILAKKKAAASVTGSPGATRPNTVQARPLREELEANLDALMGSKI